jgi:hypothetical protein
MKLRPMSLMAAMPGSGVSEGRVTVAQDSAIEPNHNTVTTCNGAADGHQIITE